MTKIQGEELFKIAEEAFRYGSPWTLDQFKTTLEQATTKVCCYQVAGNSVGFCLTQVLLDEAEILLLAVLPSKQGNGYGHAIMEEVKQGCRKEEVNKLFLETRLSNLRARNFYKKNGFREVAVRTNYYHHPIEDGIMMSCEL